MIPSKDMADYIILSLPAFSAIICLVMYLCSSQIGKSWQDRNVRVSLTGYFFCIFYNWMIIAFHLYFPEDGTLFYVSIFTPILLARVFFYRFIYTITRLPGDKRFSLYHYVLPVFFGLVSLISAILPSGLISYEMMEPVVRAAEKSVFFRFLPLVFKMRFIYDIIYITLSLFRIRRYRRESGNYASQLHQSYMAWLNLLIILTIILSVWTIIIAFDWISFAKKLSFFSVILLITQHILIVYNVIVHNYLIIENIPEGEPESVSYEEEIKKQKTLGKREFEKFFAEKKPFTDADLKITDLATELGTNRTYLSVFINTTYSVNFSSLVNERRLKYLEELRANSAMKNKTNIELIHIAGFGSYQSYLRAKEKQTERSILKV